MTTTTETGLNLVAADDPEFFPCTTMQERFWFLEQLDPGNPALNIAIRWNIVGRFNATSLEAAFRTVIRRHEILRTRFVAVDGRPMQQILPDTALHLSEIDIRSTPEAEQAARIDAIATENARLPFDLSEPGLMRATLIRLGNERGVMAITVHHIGFDGWSIRNLGREIGEAAAAIDAGREPDLPDLPLQYCDFALWEEACVTSGSFAEDLAAWRKQLQGAPYFELPPDYPRPFMRTSSCGSLGVDLPVAFGHRLEAEASRRSMSIFAFGAGVLTAMLSRVAQASEVTIGTQVAGRSDVSLEPLIGVFINDIVLRIPVPGDPTLDSHLERTRDTVRTALARHGVPLHKVVEAVAPRRDPSRTPLVSINFILQKAYMEARRYGSFELSSAPSHTPGALHDLNFMLVGRPGGWRMTLDYNSDLFARQTAERLVELWQAAFSFALEDAARPLSAMPAPLPHEALRRDDSDDVAAIEQALSGHSLVEEVAVVRHPGTDAGSTFACHAFVVPAKDATLALETMPRVLTEHLANLSALGATPVTVSVLLALPRDDHGRLDRTRLPAVQPPEPAAPAAPGLADVEARLAKIWCDLLGVETIPPEASFFDLGGHSLLTVRMIGRIEQEFGKRLSVAIAYRAPTLRALTRALCGDAARPATPVLSQVPDWRVVVVQPEGEGIPIISMNNVKMLFAITERFSQPRIAAAVQIFDKSRGRALPDLTFEQIAAEYADAVRAAQPHGPYALFGVCVHGNLALEVARKLKAEGEEVAAVIIKDVWEPRYAARIAANRLSRLRNWLHFVGFRWRALGRGDISTAAFLGMFRRLRNSPLMTLAVRLGLMERVRTTDLDVEQEEFIAYLTRARDRYLPEPYDGTVVHFVTSEAPSGRGFSDSIGWEDLVRGRLVTRRIPLLAVSASGVHGAEDAAKHIETVLFSKEGEGRLI